MKSYIRFVIFLLVVGCSLAAVKRKDPCAEARLVQKKPIQTCGNDGTIYPNKYAFECSKLRNANLRPISCSDSLILAKNALRTIRQKNANGEITTSQRERMRQRQQEWENRKQG